MFFKSEEGKQLRKELKKMVESNQYSTRTTYSTSDENGVTFIDKHMKYMSIYPNINHQQYVSNLKLMTKIR